jgi:probable rRNA maturation factor
VVRVEVFAADEQNDEPVDLARWRELARRVLDDAGVPAAGRGGAVEVSLLFVDEAAIASLNERFLGRKGPTDVLAFPIDDEPVDLARRGASGRGAGGDQGPGRALDEEGALPFLLGDVVICPAVARRNAAGHTGTYEDELALLVVHGLLHLLGMDHERDEEAEVMEAAEQRLLGVHHRTV